MKDLIRIAGRFGLGLAVFCACPAALTAQVQKPVKTDRNLLALSNSLQSLTRRISPSVVEIISTGFAANQDSDRQKTGLSSSERNVGSGVILSADGFIVTNMHVVHGARRIQVHLGGSTTPANHGFLDAKLIGTDSETDLAVIKIDGANLPFLTLSDSSEVAQGQFVLAFGNPMGMENSVSFGVVSSVARRIGSDDPREYIQTDAAINPGNSGGPLVNVEGSVIGLNTFIMTESGGSEGIGFAIPSDVIRYVVEQLRSTGHVHRGQFGIITTEITPALAQGLKLPQDSGVLVDDVVPDGPSDKAGIEPGDILLSINGKPLSDLSKLSTMLYHYSAGDILTVEVMRDGAKRSMNVIIRDRPDDPERFTDKATQEEDLIARLGILALTLNDDIRPLLPSLRIDSGVIVAALTGASPYFGDDIKTGDIIHSINGKPIMSVAALRTELDQLKVDDPVVLQVERSGVLTYLVLERN